MSRLPVESRTPQDTPQILVNQRELLVREISDLAVRTNARLEADLVRVLVPDAGHDLLIHEEALERRPATRAGQLETFRSQLEKL